MLEKLNCKRNRVLCDETINEKRLVVNVIYLTELKKWNALQKWFTWKRGKIQQEKKTENVPFYWLIMLLYEDYILHFTKPIDVKKEKTLLFWWDEKCLWRTQHFPFPSVILLNSLKGSRCCIKLILVYSRWTPKRNTFIIAIIERYDVEMQTVSGEFHLSFEKVEIDHDAIEMFRMKFHEEMSW